MSRASSLAGAQAKLRLYIQRRDRPARRRVSLEVSAKFVRIVFTSNSTRACEAKAEPSQAACHLQASDSNSKAFRYKPPKVVENSSMIVLTRQRPERQWCTYRSRQTAQMTVPKEKERLSQTSKKVEKRWELRDTPGASCWWSKLLQFHPSFLQEFRHHTINALIRSSDPYSIGLLQLEKRKPGTQPPIRLRRSHSLL